MNLQQTLDLYGGGRGSGCNPEVGKCGRPKGSGTGKGSTAQHLADMIRSSGGFTYKPASHRSPHIGFAVAITKEFERVLTIKTSTAVRIKAVLDEYKDALKKDPRAHVGGWYDEDSGKVVLDVSIVVRSKAEGMTLAKKYDQLAIFDLKKGKSLRTGIKRKLGVAAAGEKKLVRFDFERGATAEEISTFLKDLGKKK